MRHRGTFSLKEWKARKRYYLLSKDTLGQPDGVPCCLSNIYSKPLHTVCLIVIPLTDNSVQMCAVHAGTLQPIMKKKEVNPFQPSDVPHVRSKAILSTGILPLQRAKFSEGLAWVDVLLFLFLLCLYCICTAPQQVIVGWSRSSETLESASLFGEPWLAHSTRTARHEMRPPSSRSSWKYWIYLRAIGYDQIIKRVRMVCAPF